MIIFRTRVTSKKDNLKENNPDYFSRHKLFPEGEILSENGDYSYVRKN